jgi:uncharacterized protein GlcG (DUF336 family)
MSPSQNPPLFSNQANITCTAAAIAARGAVAHAEAASLRINVAIVDRAGLLSAFLRMNDSPLHSMDIAIDKAYTAVSFRRPTSAWASILPTRSAEVREQLPRRGRFVTMGGGLPIMADGECIGAIGVSGASESQDTECAQAGLRALGLES